MNELNVQVKETRGEISFNLDELKASIAAEMEHYNNLVVTEETLKEDKKDLAMLRKAYKELNDRKIAVKKSFMEPYDKFETEVKEVLGLICAPIELIDKQVKEFEAKAKVEKKEHCQELYESNIDDMKDYLPFDLCFSEDWLKASVNDKDIIGSIAIKKIATKNDINAIKALESEIEEDLLSLYAKTHNLSEVIMKNNMYVSVQKLAKQPVADVEIVKTAVKFLVKPDDADKVRQFLTFSEIEYQEE